MRSLCGITAFFSGVYAHSLLLKHLLCDPRCLCCALKVTLRAAFCAPASCFFLALSVSQSILLSLTLPAGVIVAQHAGQTTGQIELLDGELLSSSGSCDTHHSAHAAQRCARTKQIVHYRHLAALTTTQLLDVLTEAMTLNFRSGWGG